jgi:hypothetical protein
VEPVETKLVSREAETQKPSLSKGANSGASPCEKLGFFQMERNHTDFGLDKWITGVVDCMA